MFTRRAFLSLISVVPLSLRGLASLPERRGETFLLLRCFVAGLRFHDFDAVAGSLRAGDRMVLLRDRGNVHDRRAVSVRTVGGVMLGYLPRDSNRVVATLLDLGVEVTAVVRAIIHGVPPWRRVEVVVTLEGRRSW